MIEANEVINGLYGKVFDENGADLQSTQSFEANLEFEKEEIIIPGKLIKANKVMGAKGSGTVKILHVDTRLQNKILTNPTAKYNYVGKLSDPTARGEEAVLLIGVSFDGTPLMNYELGAVGEIELNFTFDDCRYTSTID
jgi:hypothetical protein